MVSKAHVLSANRPDLRDIITRHASGVTKEENRVLERRLRRRRQSVHSSSRPCASSRLEPETVTQHTPLCSLRSFPLGGKTGAPSTRPARMVLVILRVSLPLSKGAPGLPEKKM